MALLPIAVRLIAKKPVPDQHAAFPSKLTTHMHYNSSKHFSFLTGTAVASLCVILCATSAQAQINLGSAEDFAIIGFDGITNTGNTIVNGNVSAGSGATAITGFLQTDFGPGIINGNIFRTSDGDGVSNLANFDASAANGNLAAAFPPTQLNPSLNGLLTPGVYKFDSGALLSGNLVLNSGTLDGAEFIFQIGSNLTTAVGSTVTVIGNAKVYWQVGSNAAINGATFAGNVIALDTIALGNGVVMEGRLISLTGAVTLINDQISIPIDDTPATAEEVATFESLLSPEEYTAIFQMGFAASDTRNTNIQRHLEGVRAATGGASEPTYPTGPSDSKSGMGDSKSGMGDSKSGLSRQSNQNQSTGSYSDPDRSSFFFEGIDSSVSVDGSGLASGYDFDSTGFIAGMDTRLSDNFVIGLLGGYAQSNASLTDGGSIDADSYNAAVYATYYKDNFYVDALLGAGINSYETRRASLGGFAEGDTEGWQLEGMLNTGYDFHRGNWTFGPIAGVAFTRVNIDGFTETGSVSPFVFGDQHQDSLRSNLGGKVAFSTMLGSVMVTPEIRLAWQHEFLDGTQTIHSQFGGVGSSSGGPDIDADRLILSAGLSAALSPTVSIYGYYEGRLNSPDYKSNTVTAGIKISF